MPLKDISDDDFKRFVAESKTWSELLKKCGYNNVGNNLRVKARAKRMKLNIAHLPMGHNWATGKEVLAKRKYTIEEILVENSPYCNCLYLKKRLQSELKWEHRCHSCKLTEWMGKPISLELEHKNGIHTDNRIDNLAFLCPNCHAQTDTYRGKNIKTYQNIEKVVYKCVDCKENTVYDPLNRCKQCYAQQSRKVPRPSYEQLLKDRESMSYVAIGKLYGVSDHSIRKWLRYYETNQKK